MTDTQLTIIVAAIPPTVAAVSGLIFGIMNRRAIGENTNRTNEIDKKTEVVAAHVNGQKTKDMGTIAELQRVNAALLALLAERKEIAALLAQTAATEKHATEKAVSAETANEEASSRLIK